MPKIDTSNFAMPQHFDAPSRQIVAVDGGFVFVGLTTMDPDGFYTVADGAVVRKWGTEKGLGQLANEGPLSETVLDPVTAVRIPYGRVLFLMPCSSQWDKK